MKLKIFRRKEESKLKLIIKKQIILTKMILEWKIRTGMSIELYRRMDTRKTRMMINLN